MAIRARRGLLGTSLVLVVPFVASLPCQARESGAAITIVLPGAVLVGFAAQKPLKYLTAMRNAEPKVVRTLELDEIG